MDSAWQNKMYTQLYYIIRLFISASFRFISEHYTASSMLFVLSVCVRYFAQSSGHGRLYSIYNIQVNIHASMCTFDSNEYKEQTVQKLLLTPGDSCIETRGTQLSKLNKKNNLRTFFLLLITEELCLKTQSLLITLTF